MDGTETISARLGFLGIDDETRATLRAMRPMLEAELPGILDGFYAHIAEWPEMAAMFATEAVRRHAREKQLQHWLLIAEAKFDEDYQESVRRIGRAHNRLGLEPRWYVGGYSYLTTALMTRISDRLSRRFAGPAQAAERARMIAAVNKAAMLDMDIAISIYLEEGKREKDEAVRKLADGFQASIGGIVKTIVGAAGEMRDAADGMARTATGTNETAVAVAAAAEQATANVATVAAASEEMAMSVKEIATQVEHVSRTSNQAVDKAEATDKTVQSLVEAAEKIGSVLTLIKDIAEQTNLLALNATIEAARAGEAGKGFAVVASEVKNLANQTGKATDEIAQQIATVQQVSGGTAQAIAEIGKAIGEIDHAATSISSAVEEQTATTAEVARNTQEASTGTREVSTRVGEVRDAAGETGDAARRVAEAAARLADEAHRLETDVDAFLASVNAA
ncbi:MAG: chemotaxis protein [Alphaproteobacteria bacterium]|jgi:methyl-accepting chemotaxis protein|nr:chemotaxis protein [Alphaproteobacteria bacterium]